MTGPIGIVSKEEHCQAHVRGLMDDGLNPVVLGGEATFIPPSIKVLIVRTASCSHNASATAFKWGRLPGNTLIVANGLSGIRRKLSQITPPHKEAAFIKNIEGPIFPFGATNTALIGYSLPAPFVEVEPTPILQPPVSEIITVNEVSKPSYALPKDWPFTQKWTASISRARLEREVPAAYDLCQTLRPQLRKDIKTALEDRRLDLCFFRDLISSYPFEDLKGKPLRWLALVMFCVDEATVLDARLVIDAYLAFNDGKATNLQVLSAVAWATLRQVSTFPVDTPSTPQEKLPVERPLLEKGRPVPSQETPAEALLSNHLQQELAELKNINAFFKAKTERLEAALLAANSKIDALTEGVREFNRKRVARIDSLEETSLAPSDPDLIIRFNRDEAVIRSLIERLEELETRPTPPASGKATSILDSLDEIRSRGGSITIHLDSLLSQGAPKP